MRRLVGQFLAGIFLGVNGILVCLLLLSAYSPYIHPQTHPVWSCLGLTFPLFLLSNLLFLCFWLVAYRKYAWLPLLALIGCWGPIRTYLPVNGWGKDAPEEAIKVLSYNTRAFGEKTSHTREKPNEILTYLQQSNADIICLQEYIWGERLKKKDIDYALKAYPYRHYYSLAKGLNGLGCYSKYPILSATPIKYKSRRNGSVAYRIRVDDDTLLVVNNHLESYKIGNSEVETYQGLLKEPGNRIFDAGARKLIKKLAEGTSERALQADTVMKFIERFKGQGVIVCGDFNDSPISYAHHAFDRKLEDAFVQSGNGFGFSYVQHRLYFRIDHILLSENMQSYQCTVDDTMKASDHYPIWCYVTWK